MYRSIYSEGLVLTLIAAGLERRHRRADEKIDR